MVHLLDAALLAPDPMHHHSNELPILKFSHWLRNSRLPCTDPEILFRYLPQSNFSEITQILDSAYFDLFLSLPHCSEWATEGRLMRQHWRVVFVYVFEDDPALPAWTLLELDDTHGKAQRFWIVLLDRDIFLFSRVAYCVREGNETSKNTSITVSCNYRFEANWL